MTTNNQFKLQVRVNNRPITEYPKSGETFVEGRVGSEYDLYFENMSTRRVCVVLSVDGLSVMNGQVATKNDSGYIVEPYGSVIVPGWRLDDSRVAKFKFGKIDDAYASKMGKPSNIGVIGAAVFFEKYEMSHFVLYSREVFDSPQTFGATSKSIGTEFGDEHDHQVIRVQFDRETNVAAELAIRYASAEDLKKIGIDVIKARTETPSFVTAYPFPGNGCQPPPGWSTRHRQPSRRGGR